MLLKILIVLAVIVVVFVVIVATRPGEFRVTRSAAINASPDTVFNQVNDLHKWEAWSPWAKMDPAAKTSYEGPPTGVGSSFAWAGNSRIGEGRMTITDSRPAELVRFRLDFLKPFKGTNVAEFGFKAKDGQTEVTWTMSGANNFLTKAFQMFVDCEKMVGGQFEQGLADMKTIAEREARK